jgi:hypothetical protein
MAHEHDEAFLMGQAAGIIAVMSALVQALPAATRKRVLKNLRPQFESLIGAMRATGASDAQIERKGAEWVRDLFLSEIAKADRKSKLAEPALPKADALDIQF